MTTFHPPDVTAVITGFVINCFSSSKYLVATDANCVSNCFTRLPKETINSFKKYPEKLKLIKSIEGYQATMAKFFFHANVYFKD